LPTSGSQLGSASVSGLPSAAAARIAVTGRQKLFHAILSLLDIAIFRMSIRPSVSSRYSAHLTRRPRAF
jgi:hypothetical protein